MICGAQKITCLTGNTIRKLCRPQPLSKNVLPRFPSSGYLLHVLVNFTAADAALMSAPIYSYIKTYTTFPIFSSEFEL